MNELIIQRVVDAADLERAFKLRELVFVEEQGINRDVEFDGLDSQCLHLLATIGEKPVGTLRLRQINQRTAKIERVVVLKGERGKSIGHKLMKAALEQAQHLGLQTIRLHAQTYAEAFYAKLGFVTSGHVFEEDGIPHIAMQTEVEGLMVENRAMSPDG